MQKSIINVSSFLVKNMKNNLTLPLLGLIMLVNALSYGTIIPLLYPYASRFGINPFLLSLLFASFSTAQLLATPIIGRLSDKYGRKPLLLFCLAGTSVSLALFASAQSVPMLFIARILDGITGGNNSVAQASIADSTDGKDRAKAFGLLGAAFGVGLLLGPALGGVLSRISLTAPFWFASSLALIGTILGVFLLPETLPKEKRQSTSQPLFNFQQMAHALMSPTVGIVLLLSLLTATALNAWIIGFQSFTVDVLKLSPTSIGLLFAAFGLITIVMQAGGIRLLIKKIPDKKTILVGSLILSAIAMLIVLPMSSFIPFFIAVTIYGIVSAPTMPIITALISERTKAEDQGGILGVNQSYISLGQIIGPLIAGSVATFSIRYMFGVAFLIILLAVLATRWLFIPSRQKVDL